MQELELFGLLVAPSRLPSHLRTVNARGCRVEGGVGIVRCGAQPPAACGRKVHQSTLLHAQQSGVRPSHSPQQLEVACTPDSHTLGGIEGPAHVE